MAIYPPSAARGFIAKKLGISYEDTTGDFDDTENDVYHVTTADKKFVLKGDVTFPDPISRMVPGGGTWVFEILKEELK